MALGITVASNILFGQMSVAMGEAVTSYIDNALPSYSLDSKALAELNEEADSGVIDDESTYSDPDDDGYNPDDDPDAAVWSH